MQGRSNNTSAGIQRHTRLRRNVHLRKSPQLGSQAAETLMVLPSFKYIHFLSTVLVWGSDIFCLLEKGYFLVPTPTPVSHSPMLFTANSPYTGTELARGHPVPLTTLQRAGHGHNKDHCLILLDLQLVCKTETSSYSG